MITPFENDFFFLFSTKNSKTIQKQKAYLYEESISGPLGAGLLIQKIVSSMISSINPNSTSNSLFGKTKSFKGQYDPLTPKFIHYSGHDSNILAVFSALKIFSSYPELKKNVDLGSGVVFELHETPDPSNPSKSQFFVKVLFKESYDGEFKELSLKTLGKPQNYPCSDKILCPLNNFWQITASDSIPKDWCQECENETSDVCYKNLIESTRFEMFVWMMVFFVFIYITGILGFILIRLCGFNVFAIVPEIKKNIPLKKFLRFVKK